MKKYRIDEYYKLYTNNLAIDLANKVIDIANKLNDPIIDHIIGTVVFDFVHEDCVIYDRQWLVIMTYCSPLNANYDKALNRLFEDIGYLIKEVEE